MASPGWSLSTQKSTDNLRGESRKVGLGQDEEVTIKVTADRAVRAMYSWRSGGSLSSAHETVRCKENDVSVWAIGSMLDQKPTGPRKFDWNY